MRSQRETVVEHLQACSPRFRRFIDLQLQTLAQAVSDECNYLYGSLVLSIPRQGTFSIRGGTSALAETLADSIKRSGGTTRLNTAVLRLAYNTTGAAIGVDLLSGETVNASRAIISNMTVWDTYGKLIGLKHIEPEVRNLLGRLRGWGVYLLYLGMKEAAVQRLPADRIFALTDWLDDQPYDPETVQLTFAAATEWDARAPTGERAVTVQTFTRADDWFTFQENESDHEEQDQRMLEDCWRRLHSAIPELGEDIEVIDTATPRTFYDHTRRRLGMVGGVGQSQAFLDSASLNHRTSLPKVFMVGDTTFPGVGIAAVSHSALVVANHLTA
jgi:prolycopene isomerase